MFSLCMEKAENVLILFYSIHLDCRCLCYVTKRFLTGSECVSEWGLFCDGLVT